MAVKGIVAAFVVFVVFLSFVDPDESTAIVLLKGDSIWVPTRVKRPRHQRFFSKPHRSVSSVETLSREVSGIFVLLLLLSGDVELNPGPCICPICEDQILEAKGKRKGQDAIFCDGTCQSWLHRGCAGLSHKAFEAQVNSKGKFYCPNCHLNVFEVIVADLKRELSLVKNALSTISSHTDQEQESGTFSDQLQSMHKSYASVLADSCPSLPPRSLDSSRVLPTAETGEDARRKEKRVRRKSAGTGNHTQWVNVSHSAGRSAKQVQQMSTNLQLSDRTVHKQKIKIPGLRKVWGSVRSCTTNVMANTISSLCPTMVNKLQLRRKYKITPDGQVRLWWFLIRGDEEVLLQLEKIWSTVAVQTSWKLEECVKFADSRSPESSSAPDGTSPEVKGSKFERIEFDSSVEDDHHVVQKSADNHSSPVTSGKVSSNKSVSST